MQTFCPHAKENMITPIIVSIFAHYLLVVVVCVCVCVCACVCVCVCFHFSSLSMYIFSNF